MKRHQELAEEEEESGAADENEAAYQPNAHPRIS